MKLLLLYTARERLPLLLPTDVRPHCTDNSHQCDSVTLTTSHCHTDGWDLYCNSTLSECETFAGKILM